MAYRIAAINEAALEEQREIDTFAETLYRERDAMFRRVVTALAIAFASAFVVIVSFVRTHKPERVSFAESQTCTSDTWLCWSESQHAWTPVDGAHPPEGTCFESLGTCSAK
jgi:hypothetical protein